MFVTDDPVHLRGQINHFKVPMFIAERNLGEKQFRLLAINEAHERQTGMQMENTSGRTLNQLLPAEQAAEVHARYSRCAQQQPSYRYNETLQLPKGVMIWDTTLQHMMTAEGSDRIVGSAVCLKHIKRDPKDTMAFEDVRYFSTQASCNLSRVAAVFDAVQNGTLDSNSLTDNILVLAGICRSVDTAMVQLRQIAEDRLATDSVPEIHLLDSQHRDYDAQHDAVAKAVGTLVSLMEAEETQVNFPDDAVDTLRKRAI